MKPDEVPDGGLIHYAGSSLRFGNVIRQRCSWCGAILDETDTQNIAVPMDQIPEGMALGDYFDSLFMDEQGNPRNKYNGLVWVSEGAIDLHVSMRMSYALDEPEDGKAPQGSCMQLDLEVTR